MDTKRATECAERLVREGSMGTWSFEALFICLKADFRCVYSRRDLIRDRDVANDFSDRDIFFYFSHFDHLLPKSRYPELENERSNKVLSCVPCNRRKRAWDPNEEDPSYLRGSGRPLEDSEREKFIDRTRKQLEPIVQRDKDHFSKQKKLIMECFPDVEHRCSAGVLVGAE